MFTISEKETLDPVLESLPAKRKIKQSKPVLNCKTTQGITPEILPSGERRASKDLTRYRYKTVSIEYPFKFT